MYQGKVRVRVCGILIQSDRLLLLKHEGIGEDGFLWSPPGGGVEFGERAETTLKREFLEETGLRVDVRKFLFTNEHIDHRHHAIELFFEVVREGGELKLGSDPELEEQILTDLRFLSMPDIRRLPATSVHCMLSRIRDLKELIELKGYY